MITKTRTFNNKFTPPDSLPLEETICFDIETTGFSADVTTLYLIGCIYYENEKLKLIQWFAEDKPSEIEVLKTFVEFIKKKKYLICYNGTTFDLPYLKKKYEKYRLEFNTESHIIIDFYRIFSSYKNFLGLGGLRQKDIEAYLDICRDDTFSGGELVEWYAKYLKLRFSDTSEKENIYKTLLLHNSDGLIGLAKLTSLYNFICRLNELTNSDYLLNINTEIKEEMSGSNERQIYFSTTVDFDFTKEINAAKNGFSCQIYFEDTINKNVITLKLPLINAELKHFYKDYKNYYYLPKEDIIVHKNLATFVDKENKEKATAANCYTKHSGRFAKIPGRLTLPAFKTDYSDKALYILIDDKTLSSDENLNEIFKSVLKYLIK